MACCGGSTAKNLTIGQSRGATVPTLFEYSGEGALTLFGRVTGVRYHFPGPGARAYVDARDAPAFEVVKGLDVVKTEGP
jgi:hypothetical protein